jgi:hypothetical protein
MTARAFVGALILGAILWALITLAIVTLGPGPLP